MVGVLQGRDDCLASGVEWDGGCVVVIVLHFFGAPIEVRCRQTCSAGGGVDRSSLKGWADLWGYGAASGA